MVTTGRRYASLGLIPPEEYRNLATLRNRLYKETRAKIG